MSDTLSLSDEEFANLPVPDDVEVPQEEPTEPQEEVVEAPEGDSSQEQESTEEEPQNELQTDEEETSTETSEEVIEENTEEGTEEEIDYKTAFEEVFKPFKANGKEMQVDSVEDVRQLMQMGANYNKKMAALKPNLKLLKMLENNELLNEEKLAYLIDLDKRNPEAIKKLIKDSGVDPLDIDINSDVSYKPNTYTVNDKELELDAVLSKIKETDTFSTTIDIIGNKWDEASKLVLLDNPNVIEIINSHVSSGVYQTITDEVEKLRTLGRLDGLSDIDAYKAVGDALYAQPKGNNINATTSKVTNTNKEDPRLKERKKAASTIKSVASNAKPSFNPLAMPDEEFEKFASSKFI